MWGECMSPAVKQDPDRGATSEACVGGLKVPSSCVRHFEGCVWMAFNFTAAQARLVESTGLQINAGSLTLGSSSWKGPPHASELRRMCGWH